MKLLGTLRARLLLESEDFRRGLQQSTKRVESFEKQLGRLRTRTLAQVASFGALSLAIKKSFEVADEYDKSERQLAATAKLTGTNLDFLNSIAAKGQEQFKLSQVAASGFAIELAKLAKNAGDVSKAGPALAAALDLGAARGLDATETLQRLSQVIVGIDAGFDNLIGMNASVVYKEWADSINTTVGRLTDQQKAQAVLNKIMQDGATVRGEYQKWLTSSAGQSYLLAQGIEQTYAALGKALQPALVAILPPLTEFANAIGWSIREVEVLGARLAPLPELMAAIGAAARRDFAGFATAMEQYKAMKEAADEMVASIRGGKATYTAPTLSLLPTNPDADANAGRDAARRYFDGLKEEWERLRHDILLRGFGGDEAGRLDLELGHSLRMLDIEEERLRLARRRNEISDNELDVGLKEVEARREIAKTRNAEFKAIDAALKKQQNLLDLSESLADLLPSPSSGPGSTIGSQAATVAADKWLTGWQDSLMGFGAMIVPGVGGLVGGLIGSLFGGQDEPEHKVVSSLDAIQRNTKETIDAIEQQTERLLRPENRLINAPSSFRFPQYAPIAPTMTGDIVINITTQQVTSPEALARRIKEEVSDLLDPRGRTWARPAW